MNKVIGPLRSYQDIPAAACLPRTSPRRGPAQMCPACEELTRPARSMGYWQYTCRQCAAKWTGDEEEEE